MAIPLKLRSPHLLDKNGNIIKSNYSNPITKQAFGQFGSIYEYPAAGRFRSRIYTNQDTELGVSQYNRDLLVRWAREMVAQQPWIYAGIKTLSLFSVGDQYKPLYSGNNSVWGEEAVKWLKQVFYPNCCSRGPNYNFQTIITLFSEMVDQDGDLLVVFGEDNTGPKIQLVPCHRIRTVGSSPFYASASDYNPVRGPLPNTTISDGVVYDLNGRPLGYSVQNMDNMVNATFSETNGKSVFVSAKK